MKKIGHKKINILTLSIIILIILSGYFYKRIGTTKVNNKIVQAVNKEVLSGETMESDKKPNKIDKTIKVNENNSIKGYNTDKGTDKYAFDSKVIEKFLSKNEKIEEAQKIVFLTFDDGPSTTITPVILDILDKEKVKGTFFVVGNELIKGNVQKDILKRAYFSGQAIGNHTFSHQYSELYPKSIVNAENFMKEVHKNEILLKDILGSDFNTRVLRIPGGHMSWKGMDKLDKLLYDEGYTYIDWNVLIGDAEGKAKNKEQILERFKQTFRNQKIAVVLMHDIYGKEGTVEALPEIIKFFKEKGYEFKTLK